MTELYAKLISVITWYIFMGLRDKITFWKLLKSSTQIKKLEIHFYKLLYIMIKYSSIYVNI